MGIITNTLKKQGLISVIMPCYNAEKYIEKKRSKVLEQTYSSVELIVVDDGSTDASLYKLKKMQVVDSRVRIFQQENKGPGSARNKGLSEACGEYIAFLDSDDYWAENCLEKLQKALLKKFPSGNGLAYCGWQSIGLPEKLSQPFVPPDYGDVDLSELFLGGCRWPIHAVLVFRKSIEDIGGFDEQWTSCMDYDLWLRMTPFLKVVLVPEVLAFYRHHGNGQITSQRAVIAQNHWKVQKNFLKDHPEIKHRVGKTKINQLLNEELLRRAYYSFWKRDLEVAHKIFRLAMKSGVWKSADLKYTMPALLPLFLYKRFIGLIDGL